MFVITVSYTHVRFIGSLSSGVFLLIVLEFPPRESLSKCVSFESLYGTGAKETGCFKFLRPGDKDLSVPPTTTLLF